MFEKKMKKFEVYTGLMDHPLIEIEALFYNTDEKGELDFMIFNEEGYEDSIATFKKWEYVRLIG